MKFRKFLNNKLWRDKAVDRYEASPEAKIHWARLNDQDYAHQLKLKLQEEVKEVFDAQSKEELIHELADVLEVVTAVANMHNCSMDDIKIIQEKKFQERGGFHGRKFVTISEFALGSYGEKYCLSDPDKYPEIIEE